MLCKNSRKCCFVFCAVTPLHGLSVISVLNSSKMRGTVMHVAAHMEPVKVSMRRLRLELADRQSLSGKPEAKFGKEVNELINP